MKQWVENSQGQTQQAKLVREFDSTKPLEFCPAGKYNSLESIQLFGTNKVSLTRTIVKGNTKAKYYL